MEKSNEKFPRDSLSHLIGRHLEEVLPGRGDKVLQPAKPPRNYGNNPPSGNMTKSGDPWVSGSNREHLLHQSVRRSDSMARVQLR